MILCEFLYTLPYAVREESLGKTNPSLKFGSCCFTIVLQIEQILLAFQQSRSCKQTYLSWVYSEMDEYLLLNLYKYNIFVLVGVFGKRNICCIIPYSNRYEVTPYLSSPRAKHVGPKGLCAESCYWQTVPLQWEGGRLFDGSTEFFYGNCCNSGTESRKIVPNVGN